MLPSRNIISRLLILVLKALQIPQSKTQSLVFCGSVRVSILPHVASGLWLWRDLLCTWLKASASANGLTVLVDCFGFPFAFAFFRSFAPLRPKQSPLGSLLIAAAGGTEDSRT